jgi:predicted cation transporter
MTTILYILIAAWLAKAGFEILAGILQILAGLAFGIISLILFAFASILETLSRLWKTAFVE